MYALNCSTKEDCDDDEAEIEETSLKIMINQSGDLVESNQVHDYLFRGDTLMHMNFYDFCRCV